MFLSLINTVQDITMTDSCLITDRSFSERTCYSKVVFWMDLLDEAVTPGSKDL